MNRCVILVPALPHIEPACEERLHELERHRDLDILADTSLRQFHLGTYGSRREDSGGNVPHYENNISQIWEAS